jgi:hypothetical protein
VPVAHTYNPCYLGGRDQVDYCSKPTSGKYFMKPYIEKIKTFQKRAAGVAPCVGPEFKPQYYKKKKKLSVIDLNLL